MPASIKHLTDKKINLTSLLARWKDGLYYTAAIVRCDKINKRCLVCFEDGSEIWVNNRDVHIQLTLDQLNEDEDIVCCICDDGNSEAPNEIILCDVCQQGYHQRCHNPPVDSSKIDDSEDSSDHKDWFCATCSYILNQSNRSKLSATAQQQQQLQQQNKEKSSSQEQKLSQQQPKPKAQQWQPQQPHLDQQQAPPSPHKQSVKLKNTSPTAQQQSQQKSTVGPIKTPVNHVQKQAPYYPLTSPARVVATSSTAALASMTASSALVVGSSAGRTKQDLVNQSNRSSQRQRQHQPVGISTSTSSTSISTQPNNSTPVAFADVVVPPVKHAVRKSSVNFVVPIRQSALPIATRSALPNVAPPAAKLPPNLAISKPTPETTSAGASALATTTTTIIPIPAPQQQIPTKVSPIYPNPGSNNLLFAGKSSSLDSSKIKQMVIASTTSTSTSSPVVARTTAMTTTSVKSGASLKDPSTAVVCVVAASTTINSSASTQSNNSNKSSETIALTGSNKPPNSSSSPSDVSITSSLRNADAESGKASQPTVIVSSNQVGQKST